MCAKIADEKKGTDIILFDIKEISSVADYFVFITGSNNKHVKALAEEIGCTNKKKHNIHYYHMEGLSDSKWVIIDYFDVVIHVFTPEARQHYDLERLWEDAQKITYGTVTDE
ncbi:MAG: ribosome silencing factor [Candidatus Ancaeobacter aquaticus]|nr:ribosome silencing factor [Candidatus Ancaeobacter aquaticus]